MRYFVTGATGFIGGRLVRMLRSEGHAVAAVVRDPARARDLADLGVEIHPGDLIDRESMRAPMAGVDGVFHLAAWYKVGEQDAAAERINVEGTRNVLTLMRELSIPKGVYTSTLAVFSDTGGKLVTESYRHDGPWLSTYDRTKWQAHYEVALPMIEEGLPLVVVQPGVVYGPGDAGPMADVFTQYLQGRLPAAPRGVAYCWGHVDDTARGHLLAMERGRVGESYILAGPSHTLIEALDLAERLTGKKAPWLQPSPEAMKVGATIMGLLENLVSLPPTFSSEALRVTAGVTYLGDSTKAREELGFNTRSLQEGLKETLDELQQRLGMPVLA